MYYALIFDKISNFINQLSDSSKAIESAKKLLADTTLHSKLLELKYYEFLPITISKLEASGLSVSDQLQLFNNVKEKLNGNVLKKFQKCVEKNLDLLEFTSANKSFNHKSKITYAPLTSVDVERSFSTYKHILRDNRVSFTPDNLDKYNIIHFNSFL